MVTEVESIYTWGLDAGSILMRYVVFAGLAYVVFYVWKKRRWQKNKIQQKYASPRVMRKEILYSLLTLGIYCAVSWIVFYLKKAGYTSIYLDIDQRGYSYFIFSMVLMVLIHDAYFYWTHRLLHHPRLFRLAHKTHHLSSNPTPWAAFSFHPLEAIIAAGIVPLIVFVIPVHPYALFVFLTYMTGVTVLGHLGYEIFPSRFRSHKIGKWQNSSTNHNLHHQYGHSNYGLYFTFWDTWMRTSKK